MQVQTNDAATALAGPGRTPFQAKQKLCRFAEHEILSPVGKVGPGERSAWIWERQAVMAAAVLFEAHERASLSVGHLKVLADLLTLPGPAGERPLIECVIDDVANGGDPVLAIMFWETPNGEQVSFHLRLSTEFDQGVHQPENWHPILTGSLWLSRLLSRFASHDNVVPFAQREA